jgi:adenosylhomocysteine nucleosidase
MAIGIIVGLALEAGAARPLGGVIAAGGGTTAGAESAAEALAAGGVRALMSFGLAGGLDPRLKPGHLLIPRGVLAAGQNWPTDSELDRLLGGPTVDLMLAESAVVGSAAAKHQLWRTTGAAAVDLESGAVAQVAARHDLPFAVLRAVCDPAQRSLPRTAQTTLDPSGRVRKLRLLASLILRPQDLPGLVTLAADAARAHRALVERARHIGALDRSPVHGGPG